MKRSSLAWYVAVACLGGSLCVGPVAVSYTHLLQWAVVRALHWGLSSQVVCTSLALISFGYLLLLLCSVYCYISMPLRARLTRLMLVKAKDLLHLLIRVRMIGRALVSYSLSSLHDLYCSPYYLSLFLSCTLPLLTVKPAPLAWF